MNLRGALAYAQLVRLPNVFSACADVLLASCAGGLISSRLDLVASFLAASGCFYTAGMAWNDFFDRADDAKTRPQRPIPSKRITPLVAFLLAAVLALVGLLLIASAVRFDFQRSTFWLAVALVVLVLSYDAVLKHTWLGPVAMGGCRFLNVILPLSIVELPSESALVLYVLPGIVGVYIVGVTWFARTEEFTSDRRGLIVAAIVMLCAVAGAVVLPAWNGLATTVSGYPYLLAGFVLFIGQRVIPAIRSPTPPNVQAAIKRCIFGLIVLDATLAVVFVGYPGLLIAFLLVPAILLGRWVYST